MVILINSTCFCVIAINNFLTQSISRGYTKTIIQYFVIISHTRARDGQLRVDNINLLYKEHNA